jgi:hypothetical protein
MSESAVVPSDNGRSGPAIPLAAFAVVVAALALVLGFVGLLSAIAAVPVRPRPAAARRRSTSNSVTST